MTPRGVVGLPIYYKNRQDWLLYRYCLAMCLASVETALTFNFNGYVSHCTYLLQYSTFALTTCVAMHCTSVLCFASVLCFVTVCECIYSRLKGCLFVSESLVVFVSL